MQHNTNALSQDEQIGQLLVAGFHGTTPSHEITELIQNHHIGGVILFSRNVQSAQQVQELTQALQDIAHAAGHRYPLLITIDQENGVVRRLKQAATVFPGNMALGAINSETMAYDIALATGRELKELGITMNLAPVADVNNNPANPVIGVRSFGEDPQRVARLVAAAVKGYRAAGIISNLKHFPGHGDTSVDSHLALPTIPYTEERLEAIELVPFKAGIAAGADSIMIAHIYLPALMSQEMLPATVSPEIIQGLLREKLGFTGVVVSDCLEMNAIANTLGIAPGAVKALQAGTDLLLVSHIYKHVRGSFMAIQEAVRDGSLPTTTVSQAAERVVQLKARLLSQDDHATQTAFLGCEEHQRLRDRAYERSITLVRNEEALIPLRLAPSQRLLVIFPQPAQYSAIIDNYASQQFLLESLKRFHPETAAITVPASAQVEDLQAVHQAASTADSILLVTVNAHLDQQQIELAQALLHTGKPLIGLAIYNPYDLLMFPHLRTYLATYEYTPPALAAAVRVLFGDIQAQGQLPVSLPGLYPLDRGNV